jgi:hypothetical protein
VSQLQKNITIRYSLVCHSRNEMRLILLAGALYRVLCLGHSLGASMAGLCTVFIKGLVPSAEVIFQGSGMPVNPTAKIQFFIVRV